MAGRNRGLPVPMKGVPHGGMPPPVHEPGFARGHGPIPHPALLEEIRESQYGMGGPRQLPPHHPAVMEEHLAAQHDDIQGLLVDNQRLAATHVALKQELEAAQYELKRTDQFVHKLQAEKDMQMRELYDKSAKLEMDLSGIEPMKAELMQVRMDIKELTAARQDLTVQAQGMTQELANVTAELQQVPAIRAEIENLKHELERARAAIEYEKAGYAKNYEHGQAMEMNLISMAREMEKMRAIADAEKRAQAAGAAGAVYSTNYGNPEMGPASAGAGYPNYANPEMRYMANPYPANYGANPMPPMNPMHVAQVGTEAYPQYGPGPGAWGAYEMQRAQGPR